MIDDVDLYCFYVNIIMFRNFTKGLFSVGLENASTIVLVFQSSKVPCSTDSLSALFVRNRTYPLEWNYSA